MGGVAWVVMTVGNCQATGPLAVTSAAGVSLGDRSPAANMKVIHASIHTSLMETDVAQRASVERIPEMKSIQKRMTIPESNFTHNR